MTSCLTFQTLCDDKCLSLLLLNHYVYQILVSISGCLQLLGIQLFFDLKKDPNEMQSRYGDPQYTRTIAALKEELNRLRKQYQVENFENP